ncbi:MAG: putative aminohydrolase SsnA [Clostridia bacterium]
MLLIGNGRLITRDATLPFLEDGCVATEGKLIKEVGSTTALLRKYPDAQFLDAHGGVIMPGLINAHNHIYSAFARGLSIKGAPRRSFLEILDGQWWTIDRQLLLEDTQASADCFMLECIENGVTAMFDHHASYGEIPGSLFAIAQSAKQFGVKANLCYEISDRDGKEKMQQAIAENVAFIQWAQKDPSGQFAGMMGMHASFTLSNETLEACVAQNPAGAGYHIHVAEGILDVQRALAEHGKRPVFRLHDFGILGEKTICGHCTHVSEAEIDLLKDTHCMVAHNPESNMGNAIGCPPVIKMFEKGLLLGLGTDGYTNDMLESYKVANLLHKHALCDPTVAWNEIPHMLFEGNREMASRFFATPMGILQKGAAADVIVMDYVPPTPMDETNLNGHILFGMSGRSTRSTVIAGEIRMKDRELIGIDKQAILAHARERGTALWQRINEGK